MAPDSGHLVCRVSALVKAWSLVVYRNEDQIQDKFTFLGLDEGCAGRVKRLKVVWKVRGRQHRS